MEIYDQKYKLKFRMAKDQKGTLPVQMFWGVKPTDNGAHLDPMDHGTLVTRDFDASSPTSQRWFIKLDEQMRQQPFVLSNQMGAIDHFMNLLLQEVDPASMGDFKPEHFTELSYDDKLLILIQNEGILRKRQSSTYEPMLRMKGLI